MISWPRAGELGQHRRVHARLGPQLPVQRLDPPARLVDRGLRIGAVVDDLVEQLRVDLRLRVATHRAEHQARRRRRAAPSPGSACASAASTAPARSTRVSSSANDEPRLLRLIPHSGTWTPDPNAEEVRLDEADEQTVAVRRAQVRGAAALRDGPARARWRLVEVDGRPARADPRVGEQRLGRHRHVRGIGDVVVAVAQPDLHRLDDEVRAVGGVERARGRSRRGSA